MIVISLVKPQLSFLELDRISLTNDLPVSEEQSRDRDKGDSYETQHAVSPSQTQGLVHAGPSKWQQGAEETAQSRHASNGRGGKLREAVDHVSLERGVDAH